MEGRADVTTIELPTACRSQVAEGIESLAVTRLPGGCNQDLHDEELNARLPRDRPCQRVAKRKRLNASQGMHVVQREIDSMTGLENVSLDDLAIPGDLLHLFPGSTMAVSPCKATPTSFRSR